MGDMLFPHENVRDVQNEMLALVQKCIETRTPLLVHAPTGLGKTAATLAPAVTYAKDKDLVVFFLTSRHTQHLIAIQTLKDIKQRFNVNPGTVSIVGKKNLCAQSGVTTLRSDDFLEYCRALREDGKCSYYLNTRTTNGLVQPKAELVAVELRNELPAPSEHILNRGTEQEMCPYELTVAVAKDAKVIIADYNYLFNARIRDAFLSKIGKKLEQCIVIIDEGHNLPGRLREQQTQRLSSLTIRRAIKEAKKYSYNEVLDALVGVQDILNKLSLGLFRDQERLVTKQQFVDEIKRVKDYEELAVLFEWAADGIREEQKTSAIGGIASFLKGWNEGDVGYSRIIAVKQFGNEPVTVLSHRCMDPSLAAKEVIDNAHNVIMMSGTLTPTSMFADVLGFPKTTVQKEFPSPFPVANKVSLIVPGVTTKFTARSEGQFKNIASICANIVNSVPGCSAIFFPSYLLRDEVAKFLQDAVAKTVFFEDPRATKEDRQELLKRFAQYKDSGAVLLGVAAGSFGEGVDLPGILKSVIVVGIPLDRPDLETKELINYYDKKFHRGWDYGYILPAVTKTLQNAGRCIRSETDRGVLVFMDERYATQMYARCFPKDWNPKLTADPVAHVKRFFATQNFI
ncbi:ATP-dependent DNA helicase [Candidatus Woesearchaeota archaeon]|nr:ATP-dependent DNA helicase [Candidatus Woesearchaeota archaeon]